MTERDEFYQMVLAKLERERDGIQAAIQAVREMMELGRESDTADLNSGEQK